MNSYTPLQSFAEVSDSSEVAPHLALLRAELARRGLDGFLIPRADEHQGEYVPAATRRLAWLTAFTGSAGMAVVLKNRAAAFVDGRYTLQLKAQTDSTQFEQHDLLPDGPAQWIASHGQNARIGFDPWLHTPNAITSLRKAAARAGAELIACDTNPIDAVWTDRPAPPTAPAQLHEFALSGEESADKCHRLGAALKTLGIDAAVLTAPDSICWLFNVRGGDVPYTPFVLSFAILHADGSADWFVDPRKLSDAVRTALGTTIRIHAPDRFLPSLANFGGKMVLADPASAAAIIFVRLEEAGATLVMGADPCQLPKACKNAIELEGMRKAHRRDGAAVANFFAWFAREAAKGELTEISAAEKLEAFRHDTGVLADLSFDSISATGAHAALPHYHVTYASNAAIKPGNVYLIDSGAQYRDGTTDITRTVIVGDATAVMKDCFTRVLKGHIALATARFPAGTCGSALDTLARRPLWEAGLDFDHGTGHGVGSYLSVHEGPQRIAKAPNTQALLPGMVVSNEPGYYRAGAFGIRTENLLAVRKASGDFEREVLEFETLTLCPIDIRLIDIAMLTKPERAWLNAYHARVREELEDLVAEETKPWLIAATQAI